MTLSPTPVVFQRAEDSTRSELCAAQALANVAKEVLVRIGAGKEQADVPGVAQNHGADLEQLEPDGRHLRTGQFGVGQSEAPDGLHQDIGAGGKQ